MSALTDATNTMPTGEVSGNEEPKKITEVVEEAQVVDAEKVPEDPVASEAPEASEATESAEAPAEEPEETTEQKTARLNENIIAGRRSMALNDFINAAELFSQAAELSKEIFEEERFEVNLLYGQALLQLGKMEDEVLNNALSDIPKEKEGDEEEETEDDGTVDDPENVPEEERAEIRQQVEEALGVADEKEEGTVETPETEVEAVEVDGEAKAEGEVEAEAMEQGEATEEASDKVEEGEAEATEEEADGEAGAEEEEVEEDDDEDQMKLAWEVLETARIICEKKVSETDAADTETLKTWYLNHAEVLSSLGEHGFTDQNYEQAQKDLLAAVAIQVEYLPPTSRLLANTHHLLGKAFLLGADFGKAVEHFANAKNILIAKVEELKKTEGEEEQVKELEELIPEIDALVVDAASSKDQYDKMKETAAEEMKEVQAVMAKFEGEETKDISGLVRRKRPVEEEVKEGGDKEEEGQELKKQKTDDDEVAPEVEEAKKSE